MDPGAEQAARRVTILAAGSRVLVVTAGRGDRGDVALRMLEQIGASCVMLDVSSAGSDPEQLRTHVQAAYEQLSGAPSSRRMALAGVGLGAGPALAAAAALAEQAPVPCVLIVNGRFDGAARPLAALGAPALLLVDRARGRRERGAQRAIARELGEGCELEVVASLAEDGDDALRAWRDRTPITEPASPRPETAVVETSPVLPAATPEPAPAPARLRAVESRSHTRAA
jgi:hypothetical protein